MTESPARLVAAILKSAGLAGASSSVDWFPTVGSVPQQGRDNLLTIFDTTGQLHGKTADAGEIYQHYGLQVRIRAADYATGWAKGQAIQDYLSGLRGNMFFSSSPPLDSGPYRVWSFNLTTPLVKIAEEEVNERQIFTLNGLIAIEKSSTNP